MLYTVATALTKVSVLLFIIRLNTYTTFMRVLWSLVFIIIAFAVASVFALCFQCHPFRAQILPVSMRPAGSKCVNTTALAYSLAAIDTVLDFAVWMVPVRLVWHIRLPLRQKLRPILLLALGFLSVYLSNGQ